MYEKKENLSIQSGIEKAHIPGISIATISNEGATTYNSIGIANAKYPSEVTRSTVFEAASLSKPVFAYIVIKLAQEGIIDLDKPLYEYGDFGPPPMRAHDNYKKLTARLILSHQAGLPNEFNPPTIPFDYVSPVGAKFDYSGEAYRFLGEVIENVSSKSLETLAQDEFAKIGMINTSFMPPTGCSLIRLRDEQEPTPETIKKLLESESDKHAQLSIIYHKDKLFVAERSLDGSVKITEKNSSQVDERAFQEMNERFASIPSFLWSKPVPIEARELPLVTIIAGHPPEHAENLAIGHFQNGLINPTQRFYGVHPAGSLYTTTSDYALFLKACVDDPYIKEEMFTPTVSSLRDKDTKAIGKEVAPEVLEQLSWGLGIGLQTNVDSSLIAFHWGDNGTGRNLAAINLNTGKAIVCLTNSANGPVVFRAVAEPVVGDLSPACNWLSKREDLPIAHESKALNRRITIDEMIDKARKIESEPGISGASDEEWRQEEKEYESSYSHMSSILGHNKLKPTPKVSSNHEKDRKLSQVEKKEQPASDISSEEDSYKPKTPFDSMHSGPKPKGNGEG